VLVRGSGGVAAEPHLQGGVVRRADSIAGSCPVVAHDVTM